MDVRAAPGPGDCRELPAELVLHPGTAAVPVRLRPLGGEMVRLTLRLPLPVEPGDRLVLRDPGRHAVAAGAVVLDADPPELRRRGAGAARAAAPTDGVRRRTGQRCSPNTYDAGACGPHAPSAASAYRRARPGRGAGGGRLVDRPGAVDASGSSSCGPWSTSRPTPVRWILGSAPRLPDGAWTCRTRSCSRRWQRPAGWRTPTGGSLDPVADRRHLGAAEAGLAQLEQHLAGHPFAAPEKPDLDRWRLGVPELAAAERTGRVVRLAADVVLLPTGPAQAMRTLAGLPQPFTTSEAREALETTRRVAIPLLEHLDRRGWTLRLDGGHRRVQR